MVADRGVINGRRGREPTASTDISDEGQRRQSGPPSMRFGEPWSPWPRQPFASTVARRRAGCLERPSADVRAWTSDACLAQRDAELAVPERRRAMVVDVDRDLGSGGIMARQTHRGDRAFRLCLEARLRAALCIADTWRYTAPPAPEPRGRACFSARGPPSAARPARQNIGVKSLVSPACPPVLALPASPHASRAPSHRRDPRRRRHHLGHPHRFGRTPTTLRRLAAATQPDSGRS